MSTRTCRVCGRAMRPRTGRPLDGVAHAGWGYCWACRRAADATPQAPTYIGYREQIAPVAATAIRTAGGAR